MNTLSPIARLRRIINDPVERFKIGAAFLALLVIVAFADKSIREDDYIGFGFGLVGLMFIVAGIVFAFRAMGYRSGQKPKSNTKDRARVMVLSDHGLTLLKSVNAKIEALTVDKSKIVAGLEGERTAGDFLLRHLNEEWTVIEGFKGGKGEIDFLLIGPLGVFAIEVKNRSGIISVNGDQWTLTKPDGSVEPLQDNGGRSPARQISESAGWLASNLNRAGFPVHVPTAIIWAHPKASLGNPMNLVGVSYLFVMGSGLEQHFSKYLTLGSRLTRDQASRAVMMIQSLHK